MAIRAVVFDLDNTLIDFIGMKRRGSHAAALAMLDAGADFDAPAEAIGDLLFNAYLGDIEGDDVFHRFVAEHDQQKLSGSQHRIDRITAAAVNAYLAAKASGRHTYPGIFRMLLELQRRGVKLALLTDAPRFKAYQRLDAAGLRDLFSIVVSSDDHGSQKPDPRAFRTVLDALALPAGQVLMVGDWPERDILGAHEAGMKTALAAYGAGGKPVPVEANLVIAKPDDLVPAIETELGFGQ